MLTRLCLALGLMAGSPVARSFAVDPRNSGATPDGSPARPFPSLAAALNAAAPGDTVKAARGEYPPLVLRKGVILRGGYPGSGDFGAPDPASHASVIRGTAAVRAVDLDASGVILEGFTITGGVRGIDFTGWEPISDIRIADNLIEKNGDAKDADQNGGGIAFHGTRVAIVGNVIRDNVAGNRGAAIARNGTLVDFRIEGNRIAGNTGYGDHAGGVYLDGTGTLARNLIEGNRCCAGTGYGWGGGVFVYGYGKGLVRMAGNVIRNNRAGSIGGGVFIDEGGRAILENELIYGNATEAGDKGGAGIYVDGAYDGTPSSATLINCTVANNRSPGTSGGNGLYVEFCGPRVSVVNSIFWGNGRGDDFFLRSDSDRIAMTYSLSQEKWPGTGNLSIDPLFADTAAGDFHLRSMAGRWAAGGWVQDPAASPAVDAGHPDSAFAREPAPNGGRIDLGAYGNTAEASKSGGAALAPSPGQAALRRHFRVRWERGNGRTELVFELPILGRIRVAMAGVDGKMKTVFAGTAGPGERRVAWDGAPWGRPVAWRLEAAGLVLEGGP